MDNKLKCSFPSCNEDHTRVHALDVINEKNAKAELPFCDYHYFIVIGGHFKAEVRFPMENLLYEEPTPLGFKMVGPFEEVEVAQQVFAAIKVVEELKSNDKK